jgi:hypothetical protein
MKLACGSPGWTRLVIIIAFLWAWFRIWFVRREPKSTKDLSAARNASWFYSKKHFISSSNAASNNFYTFPLLSSAYRNSLRHCWYFYLKDLRKIGATEF